MFNKFMKFVRKIYKTNDFIPLHAPVFLGNEKKYLNNCIDSTFVSSVGEFVNNFENKIAEYTGAKYAIATMNGTSALHISLLLSGVEEKDEVITQPMTFVATANAIKYCHADPIFVDIDQKTLGLSFEKLKDFLENRTETRENGWTYNKITGKRIKACVPMHSFGHPVEIDKIIALCKKYNISVVEDAAESLGSFYKNQHTGTFGDFGILSFNGNKITTSGAGGMILTNDEVLAKKAKHLTTTAKIPHSWEYDHDFVGYNYRLSNLSAALGLAQLEKIDFFLKNKRETAKKYERFFEKTEAQFISEPKNSTSNYWLNAVLLKDKNERDHFLKFTNEKRIMTRPAWKLMTELKMFKNNYSENIDVAKFIADRLVNIPSSVVL
jgi:perosamine synthetase